MTTTRATKKHRAGPVFALEPGFRVQHAVVFDPKDASVAEVRAIPDDAPDSRLEFEPTNPPSLAEFEITVASYKDLRGRWIAHLDSGFWYPSGAAVLLQLSAQKFVYIGDEALTFEVQPRDEVVEFRVRLEGARLLAWVRCKNNTYLLASRILVPNKHVDECESMDDPYACADGCDDGTCAPIRNLHERL